MQRETHAESGGKTSFDVKYKFFHKIWKSLISIAIEVGMTRIANNAETTPIQAPGGAMVGTAPLARLSPIGETKSRETGWITPMEASQAGGPEATLRPIHATRSGSPKNGTTVACRGAGQSARIPFRGYVNAFIKSGARMPGGSRNPECLLC
jgi:hypothetical protein